MKTPLEDLEARLVELENDRAAVWLEMFTSRRRLDDLEQKASEERLPLARAARLLGVSRKHVLRLGQAGALDLLDVRAPGAPKATWTVSRGSLERWIEARRGRPGPVGQAADDSPSPPRLRRAK